MFHHRLQLFAQLYSHLLDTLTGLIQTSLYRGVLYVVFLSDRSSLGECLGCFLLFPFYHIQITCQSRNDLCCTGTVLAHILEYWSKYIDVAQFVQGIKQHE